MATYNFVSFKSTHKKPSLSYTVTLVIPENTVELFEPAVRYGTIVGEGVNRARTWCDLPPNHLTPSMLAEYAQQCAYERDNLTCTVYGEKDMQELGFGGVLAVSKGSDEEGKFIIMRYTGSSEEKAPLIGLVGKGVTFDSGGLSIKPASAMEDMKDDMAGAAAVISTMQVLSELKPPVNVIAIAPVVENMLGGKAMKPGDIITFYNGKTAEVKNTDAEGRLILADALSYITKHYNLDILIDIATLTGSCAAALGPFFAGIMTQDDFYSTALRTCGKHSGERLWELPMHPDYEIAVRSPVADVSNIGSSQYRVGALAAAFFLKQFIDSPTPWVHLDIAGVSFNVPDRSYYRSGATGFGVRLFVQWCMNYHSYTR